MKILDRIALVLVIIGGLNWGSIGFFGLDMVAALFGGSASGLSRLVYILVCVAALWCITLFFREDRVVRRPAAQGRIRPSCLRRCRGSHPPETAASPSQMLTWGRFFCAIVSADHRVQVLWSVCSRWWAFSDRGWPRYSRYRACTSGFSWEKRMGLSASSW